jgi:hypothetical protein
MLAVLALSGLERRRCRPASCRPVCGCGDDKQGGFRRLRCPGPRAASHEPRRRPSCRAGLGFYGRLPFPAHPRGTPHSRVNYLDELSKSLRQSVLLIDEKVASGTTADDAEELARYQRLGRGTNAFIDFVASAIA